MITLVFSFNNFTIFKLNYISMKRYLLFIAFTFSLNLIQAQTSTWSSFIDDIPSLSSPRLADLTGDGVKDVVMGGGTDSTFSNHGIMAFNGATGALLWELPSKNEIFASAQFQDITSDGIPDVFISGREAQLYAINGSTGAIIWEYFPFSTDPALVGLYNFYSPQFIPDASGDLIPDILVSNGGDHNAPVWQTNRPPAHLMVVNSMNGSLIAQAVVPDSNETYCSPVVADLKDDGNLWVVFGTGGETLPGSMWAVLLSDVLNNDISNATQLATHPTLGFVAPPSVGDFTQTGKLDIIIQGYGGTISRVRGADFGLQWSVTIPNSESSAAPVIGNFTGAITPDVFCVLAKGTAPSYTDFYQVMIDGRTGSLIKKDSIGMMHFASANAFDSNGDGRDEVLVSVNNHVGYFKHQLMLFDYQNNTYNNYWNSETGVNIGCTPWIGDMNNNGDLEIIYVVKEDSLNPMGWQGINVRRLNTGISMPIAGVAWGSYMGTNYDGHYNYTPDKCGVGSIFSGASNINPSCNGFSNGSLTPLTANGTPPFTYLWDDGSVGSSLTNVPAGTYTLRITDASGCFEEVTAALVNPFNINFGGVSNVLCEGGSNGLATVSSSGCVCMFSGCTYLWDNGGTTYNGTGLDAGPHSVTITHNNGCIVVATININDGAPLVDSVILQNVSCNGFDDGSIEIIPTNISTTAYNWSTLDNTSSITSLVPGNYAVNIQDTRPCSETLNFTITEPDSLLLDYTVTAILCNGDNDGEIVVTSSGGNSDFLYYVGTNNSSTGVFSALDGGSYDVYVMDSLNCSSDTISVMINEPTAISTVMSSTPESIAGNGTATVVISGGTAPYSQLWDDAMSQTTATTNGLVNGWYTVVVTDDNGCTDIDSVEVISTVAINDIGEEIELLIYPNPAIDYMELNFGTKDISSYEIELIDISGKQVPINYEKSWNKVKLIRDGRIANGNYIFVLRNETELFKVQVSFQ